MRDNSQASLKWVIAHEGYISNDKYDPGGLTKWGIIQSEYNAFRRLNNKVAQSVRLMTWDEMTTIYIKKYMASIHYDDLPSGIDNILFDMAVNSGPRAAILLAQKVLVALGHTVAVDGILGVETLGALHDIDPRTFIERFTNRHLQFFRSLRTWWRFGGGWKARIFGRVDRNGHIVETGVLQESLSLIGNVASKVEDAVSNTLGDAVPQSPQAVFETGPYLQPKSPLTAH